MKPLQKYTLLEVLKNSVNNFSNNVCLAEVDKGALTYQDFGKNVEDVQNFLKDNGIKPGDKVSILSENSPNWGIAYFAITTMGAVAVPIMTEFHESEVLHCIRHSESKAIFVSLKLYEKIVDAKLESLSTVILIDDFSIIPKETKHDILKDVLNTGKKEFAKIKNAALKFVGAIEEEVKEDSLASILYTSGTTGHSKGVMLTHKNIVFDAYATTKLVEIGEYDKMLSILPLFHTIESTLGLVTPILVGASVNYLSKPPTASVLLPALKKVSPTVMLSVPLVIEKIYHLRILPEFNKKAIVRGLYKINAVRKKLHKIAGKKLLQTFGGNLRMFCIGGAALSGEVERFLREAGFPYAIGYGLTETAPLVTGTGPERTKIGSCGVPLYGMEIKIDNEDPETKEGEVLIKAPNVMKGYYKDKEKTDEVFTEDGWFKTGDLGLIEGGYLYIKGRSKNVIIGANGKNIYPEEIESILNGMEFVLESLVLQKDEKLIAKVHLDYENLEEVYGLDKLEEGKIRDKISDVLKTIQKNLNEQLSSFSRINKVVEQPEPFEKTPTKKIKRYLYV